LRQVNSLVWCTLNERDAWNAVSWLDHFVCIDLN
jgi:hypothetical protein